MAISAPAFSQLGGMWNFQWGIGFPLAETNNFVATTSFRSFNIEGRAFVTDNILVGGRLGWNVFYHNLGNSATQIDPTRVLFGFKQKTINAVPLMATVHYEIYKSDAAIIPYFGFGIGTYYIERRSYVSIYFTAEDAWHFGFYPEAGVVIPVGGVGSETGINVSFNYNYAAKTRDTQAESWLGINIGISYLF